MDALMASIVLNTSLVSSLSDINRQSQDTGLALFSLPVQFLNKQKEFLPLFAIATINQLVLIGLTFFYFSFCSGVFAYLLGIAIAVVLEKIVGRLKWFGVYLFPVPILVLTYIAFKQMP